MSIRDDYAGARWVLVMQPAGADHPRIPRGCPVNPEVFDCYYRAHSPVPGEQGSWFLDGDDPAWERLPLWEEVAPRPEPENPVVVRERKIEEYAHACAAWEDAVQGTEWGSDPMWWLNVAALDPSAAYYDRKAKRVRRPFVELVARYGTASIVEYATSRGMPPPRLEL